MGNTEMEMEAMDSTDLVVLRQTENVAQVILNSPNDCNALSLAVAGQLHATILNLSSREDVDVIVLCGAGPIFSAGANIREMDAAASKREFFEGLATLMYDTFFCIRDSSQIFIAAVHGRAVGVALPLALCCDLVWLNKDAILAPGYLNLGLFPNGGLTFLLPEAMGRLKAMELLLVQKEITAAQAVSLGLAGAVLDSVDFEAEVRARSADIARGPVLQYRKTKELLGARANALFKEQLSRERTALLDSCEGEEFRERLSAALRRKPAAPVSDLFTKNIKKGVTEK